MVKMERASLCSNEKFSGDLLSNGRSQLCGCCQKNPKKSGRSNVV